MIARGLLAAPAFRAAAAGAQTSVQDDRGRRRVFAAPPLRLIRGFPAERHQLLIRPGPRMGEAAGAPADCLAAIGKMP